MENNSAMLTTALVLHSVTSILGLSCYQCTVRAPPPQLNQTTRLCSHFDYSDKYIVNCPMSTYCLKRTVSLELNGNSLRVATRDCAPQKYSYQVYVDNKWTMKEAMDTQTYKIGCKTNKNGEIDNKITNEEYCYCEGHLCNGGKAKDTSSHTDIMTVIFVFNAMKYIRSIR